MLVERGVDALALVGGVHHQGFAGFMARCRVPAINTFVYDADSHGTNIGPDNRRALYRLSEYLIGLGHRRFGVVAQSPTGRA